MGDGDFWVIFGVIFLGKIDRSPIQLRRQFLSSAMEGWQFDWNTNNCQQWVMEFLRGIHGPLEDKLPKQFKETIYKYIGIFFGFRTSANSAGNQFFKLGIGNR
jgi:hypothetical protein